MTLEWHTIICIGAFTLGLYPRLLLVPSYTIKYSSFKNFELFQVKYNEENKEKQADRSAESTALADLEKKLANETARSAKFEQEAQTWKVG